MNLLRTHQHDVGDLRAAVAPHSDLKAVFYEKIALMRRHVSEDTCLVVRYTFFDIIDTAVDQNCLRDLIFVLAGGDVLQEFLRIVLIVDQNDRLRRVDRVVDPPHEDDPQYNNDQIDGRQSEHGTEMVQKAPAADQRQLDIGNNIRADDRTDLGDDDILHTHVAHFQGSEQF